ncbi:MAG: Leucine-tRNA ligase [Candidatus Nomurabacteria bacterium GW2011_GWF2_35_12]|uniref:Leucine--tRNA ligase n=3 Tax=Candidatus Nomuraibacteriota TaxID=1752729 RepID=A0A0G0H3Q4_9BACT|nr:MAG: Leucine-tRNA ligase [Candidatus Nomurabacteria bacterium GW2011_GWF2_35_12]KKP73034.1 MAG: Leucine-tRNA ligase [Candidatus Nomurabacteria bacterium GW2011_GWB1_35_20]KKP76373.1 MAG: leucyl-tRNA synthetase, leucyl-tRNA synthetase [Parcubacteria group bacterium GW2011_GWC1_35_21]KKP98557.1 MAG: Leucine-tRNA ligase [Candidatus Nomurabacteria bacterium GW2011_GWA1_36_15]HCY17905.1 leucine--tRNA ligase [Candidatus Nomurabacteria bacterium]
MKNYDHKKIEKKWQNEWEKKKIYQAKDPSTSSGRVAGKKFYSLIEFPYPSGEGLHVGHIRSNTAMDIISRKRRMEGYNVLYPIGWDAFGLPTENYAIKTGKKPAIVTKKNTDTFRRQLKALGYSFDWSREINTTDPKYYKWTQWIFLQLFKKGLAYKAKSFINWCPSCKIGLANEEAVGGVCDRCGSKTEKREKKQWMLAITKYADRLDKDLNLVDYPERVKTQQRNWIGKKNGVSIKFDDIEIFTTRPETIFGATFVVVAGEKDKFTGRYVTNPATKEEIPVWEAEYVMAEVGTGAIMGVPADDARDREFAEKYNLPIVENYKKAGFEDFGKKFTHFKLRDWVFSRQRYWGEPIPIISCEKCGLIPVPEKDLPVKLPEVKSYKPTDSGESPLASISKWVNTKCPKCKGKAKRETDTMPNWAGSSWYYLRYTDPKNSKEFASMKNLKYWLLGSSAPKREPSSQEGGVDWYNGGMEHTTLHLLYSRFWHKFLYDLKLVPTAEPYQKRTSHGMILGEGGVKMSKSVGNVVNPDEIVKTYGADTLRIYEMFMGPFEESVAWNTESIIGSRRFIEKVWRIGNKFLKQKNSSGLTLPGVPSGTHTVQNSSISKILNKTIKKVSEDIENMHFNTTISAMMILTTEMEKALEKGQTLNPQKGLALSIEDYKKFLQILAPFAPYITEELWRMLGEKNLIDLSSWPKWDENLVKDQEITIAVQINGKVRTEIIIQMNEEEEEVKKKALSDQTVLKYLIDGHPKKIIYVKNKVINILP